LAKKLQTFGTISQKNKISSACALANVTDMFQGVIKKKRVSKGTRQARPKPKIGILTWRFELL
jgi:hypothetical protein